MKIFRIAMTALLVLSVSGTPAFAGDLRDSVAAAATAAAKAEPQATGMASTTSSGRALMWSGAALFAGGMTYGLYQFINNNNGSYSEFGEAAATNKKAGAAGISIAFAGGAMMLLGHHAASPASLTFGRKSVGVAKKVTW